MLLSYFYVVVAAAAVAGSLLQQHVVTLLFACVVAHDYDLAAATGVIFHVSSETVSLSVRMSLILIDLLTAGIGVLGI